MIIELTTLVGRKEWIDVVDIVTMRRMNEDPYGFTELLLTNHHVVRVQERPEAIAARRNGR